MNRKKIFLYFHFLCSLLLLASCAGAIFGSAPKEVGELEEGATRAASEDEEKRLDACLHEIFKQQQQYFAKNRKYLQKVKDLRGAWRKDRPEMNQVCDDVHVSLKPKEDQKKDGYIATAKIKDGKTVVKWTLDDSGEVIEHDDMNLDFSL